jgi:hypothetical protein
MLKQGGAVEVVVGIVVGGVVVKIVVGGVGGGGRAIA